MMEFKILNRRSIDEDAWEKLSLSASFYHTLKWVDICIKGFGAEAIFLCGYDNDKLICGMPAIILRKMGMHTFLSMPNGTYGGVIWGNDITRDNKEQFIKSLGEFLRGKSYSKISIADFTNNLTLLKKPKFSRKTVFTHTMQCSDGFVPSKKTLVEIKTGEKSGGEIISVDSLVLVDQFYSLYINNEL